MANHLPLKIILILGFALTAFIYWGALDGPFLLDDLQSIEIARVSSWDSTELFNVTVANQSGPLLRPISILSFVLTDALFGQESFGYKVMNLFLHLLCGLMCFVVTRKLSHVFNKDSTSNGFALATIVSLLWITHPLLVSTTLYVVQRMAILSALFVLTSLWLYLKLRFESHSNQKKSGLAISFILCWACAIFSKENGILIPFFLLLIESVAWTQGYRQKQWLMLSLGLSLALILGGSAYYISHFSSFEATFASKGFTLTQYMQIELKALVFYLKLIVIPNLSAMGLYHDDFAKTFISPTWLNISILISLITIAIVSLKKMPLLSFGILWFFAAHSLESTILPLEPVFEHRNYLASLGVLIALSSLLLKLLQAKEMHRFGLSLPVLWVGLFAFMTFMRVDAWSTPEKFLAYSFKNHPLSARAHIETANYMFNQKAYDHALILLGRADELSPNNSGPKLHQVLAHCFITSPSKTLLDQAAFSLQSKEITPYTILVFDGLVTNHFNQQCPHVTLKQTMMLMTQALSNPHVQHKPHYLAILYHLQAGLFVKQNRLEDAVASLTESYQLNTARIEALIEKTQLLIYQGKKEEVKTHFELIQNHPKYNLKTNQTKFKQLQTQVE